MTRQWRRGLALPWRSPTRLAADAPGSWRARSAHPPRAQVRTVPERCGALLEAARESATAHRTKDICDRRQLSLCNAVELGT
eukprot:CAMPEP_0202108092 /NCGR_PEP_ID=MMETSP0965-20130614/19343_1 /ASSEMBLY_ACC=CAM_ASM_000507 /TAXON_ID=4773 /ORGANISM="Schizochytrium aggregatum, Strain ATCC28209" /LENGTH=81 /DNA_ID=CAMNT_0048677311 /DNA_START=21 /DNA_END=262 /DNA_ORIENTATION=-